MKKLASAMVKYWEDFCEGLTPDQRNELVKNLNECFFELVPRLRSDARFHCIAYILKGFKLEEGTENHIFDRIKKDYRRKIS